jgi:hypothetical protein
LKDIHKNCGKPCEKMRGGQELSSAINQYFTTICTNYGHVDDEALSPPAKRTDKTDGNYLNILSGSANIFRFLFVKNAGFLPLSLLFPAG